MNHWFVSYFYARDVIEGVFGFGSCKINIDNDHFPILWASSYISKEFCNNGNVVIINFIKITEEQWLEGDKNENKPE